MDREKVIKELTCCIYSEEECECPEDCPYVDDDMSECQAKVMRDALELLKEQEAVEPKQIVRKQCKTEHPDGSIDYYAEWFCPHCNSLLKRGFDAVWIEYCFKCGKPIDWEGR